MRRPAALLLILALLLALVPFPADAAPGVKTLELLATEAGYVTGPNRATTEMRHITPSLVAGRYAADTNYIGLIEFVTPPGSVDATLASATMTLTGYNGNWTGSGSYRVALLDAKSRLDASWSYTGVLKLTQLATLTPTLTQADLAVGRENKLALGPGALALAQRLLITRGFLVFAVFGPTEPGFSSINLFAWSTGGQLTPVPKLNLTLMTPRW